MVGLPELASGGVYYFLPERARPCDINSGAARGSNRSSCPISASRRALVARQRALTQIACCREGLRIALKMSTEITGKRAAVEGNLQTPAQTEEIGGDLWLAFDISPFIPITPMMWPHFIAKPLILKRSKEVREGQFTYPMDTSTSPY